MTKPTKPIPAFANEAQERAYWESHDSTEHLDWTQAKVATLPNLKPTTKTISLRLPQHLLLFQHQLPRLRLLLSLRQHRLLHHPLPQCRSTRL